MQQSLTLSTSELFDKVPHISGGGRAFRGKAESGKENPYSCVVLAGARSMHERRKALQVISDVCLLCYQ